MKFKKGSRLWRGRGMYRKVCSLKLYPAVMVMMVELMKRLRGAATGRQLPLHLHAFFPHLKRFARFYFHVAALHV